MPRDGRSFVLALLPVLYVAFAAARAGGASRAPLAALVGLPLALRLAFRLSEPGRAEGEGAGPEARAAFRWAAAAAAVYVAARSAPSGRPAFDAFAAAAVAAATVAAAYGLARVPEGPGLLRCPPASRRLDGAAAATLVGAMAVTVPAAAALSAGRRASIDPLTIDYTLAAEGAGCLILLSLASLRVRLQRQLELGVVDRATFALVACATLLAVAGPAAALRVAAPDRALPASAVAAALGVSAALAAPDARAVGQALRTALVAALAGVPLALGAASLARGSPKYAGAVVLLASPGLVVVGVAARRLSRRLMPDARRWLDAIERAQDRATLAEPRAALRAVLATLRERLGPSAASPVLVRAEAGDALTVDRAGYLHEARAAAPAELRAFCRAEPGHTFRLEVARALEVRNPAVRPALAWMEAHDYASVTALDDGDAPVGLLVMPRAGRKSALTLAEALALGRLGERLTSVLALSAAIAAARERRREAEGRAAALEGELARTAEVLSAERGRYREHARRLAAAASIARYSPASRLADDELTGASALAGPLALLAPGGVDAVAAAACVHARGPRSEQPFVVVDGTDPSYHEVGPWSDGPGSPLRSSAGGTLVVVDGPALPPEVQRHLAAQARGGGGGAGPPPRLVVVVRRGPSAPEPLGRLEPELGDALSGHAVALPPLSERAEDLRSIALDRLARLGLALQGSPLGIADDALARLLECPWPANDAELDVVLLRAALDARGPVVTAKDLERTGFAPAGRGP
ncbi:MAG TPA: hypothetical protein VFS43_15020 [Polyangiaceae bacterium]|nr:hypothetical protein [Polyangiaceae bacterium]